MNRFLPTSLASSLACTLPRKVSWTLSTGLCQISLPGDVPPCNSSRQTLICPLRPISGIRWHHQLNAHEFEPTLGDSEGQGGLACCSPWGLRVGHDWDWTTGIKCTSSWLFQSPSGWAGCSSSKLPGNLHELDCTVLWLPLVFPPAYAWLRAETLLSSSLCLQPKCWAGVWWG